MVFSSVPTYLDPPIWLHHHHHHHQSECGDDHENAHVPPLLPPPPPLPARGGGGGGGGSGTACTDTSKSGSMSNRSKLAKLSGQPDPALKCPRCESTNTKFCYFNNYNLSQPRHFCKTCRRYWTRGGALRNVPVGGGCRRNKRSKSGSSRTKSPATSLASISALLIPNSSCTTDHNLCHLTLPPPKLPFLPSLHHLTDHYGTFGGIHNANGSSTTTAGNDIDHLIQIGSSYSNGKFAENWRMHQSPLLETPNTGIYQFEMSEGASNYGGAVTSDYLGIRAVDSEATQAVVEGVTKMEDNSTYPGLNLSKKLLGNQSETENQYYSWAGINSNAWINASHEFASSPTSHVL